ncbi:hypothetical protein EfmJHP35_03500 [Enterococcus faecium]|nr:hypothetical protein EfmJHP35_03500 [Enterococcus faecium]
MAPSDMLTHILNNNYNNYTIGLFLFLGLIGAFIFIKKLTADDLFIFFLGVFVLFVQPIYFLGNFLTIHQLRVYNLSGG